MAGTLLETLHVNYPNPSSPTHHPHLQSVKAQRYSVLCFGNTPTTSKMSKILPENIFILGRINIFLQVYHVFTMFGRYETNILVLVGTCRRLL